MSDGYVELAQNVRTRIEALGKGSVVTEADVQSAGEETFILHLRGMAKRVAKGFKNANTGLVRVHLTNGTEKPNAFAYARDEGRSDRHLVLVTRELLDRIRTLAGQAPRIAKLINERAAASDALRSLWGDLPNDDIHGEAFGSLLTNVALGFLMNHEMAHIAFHHAAIVNGRSCSSLEIEEGAGILGQATTKNDRDSKNLQSQTIELDADIHSLNWTRIYLEDWAEIISNGSDNRDPATHAVCMNFVGTEAGRRFLLVSSSWLLLLSFPPSGFKLEDMEKGTHPALPIRLCTLLHAEATIAKWLNGGEEQARQIAASTFALLAYTGVKAAEDVLEQLSNASLGNKPRRDYSLQQAARDWGIYQTLGQEGFVQAHLQKLAGVRRKMDQQICSTKICSDDAVVRWFMDDTPAERGFEVSSTKDAIDLGVAGTASKDAS